MARIFTEELYDLPSVNPVDWELWERLEELVTPYLMGTNTGPPTIFYADDSRGQYTANSVANLRAEAERQEELPHSIRLTMQSGPILEVAHFMKQPANSFVNVYASSRLVSDGRVQSESEEFVHHVAARIRELFALAAKRVAVPAADQPVEPLPVTQPSAELARRSKLRAFFYDPWVIGVGSALIVAGIIYLVVALTH